MPEGLVESELFGHERGAFTGALSRKQGAFERANHGTLLLDEISEMRLDLQSKLLRVVQEGEFERVGGQQLIKVDVRLVATTNRDLKKEVSNGRFREDLFYRLNVVPINPPPLRERLDDIPLLVRYFVNRFAKDHGVPGSPVDPETIDQLQSHHWPGNVRELANAVERAVVLSGGKPLTPRMFKGVIDPSVSQIRKNTAETSANGGGTQGTFDTLNLAEIERHIIKAALERTSGNRTQAAKLLGISDRTLRNKLNTQRILENEDN
jgi:DNA-binding NtrC family response regulator